MIDAPSYSGPVIVCDVGGVLVDLTVNPLRPLWAEQLGLPERVFRERVWACISASSYLPLSTAARACAESFGLSEGDALRMLADFHLSWQLDLQLLGKLIALRGRAKLVILSNAGPAARFAICTLLGLDRFFDAIYISCELGLEKPDPDIYRSVEKDLGAKPGGYILMDDKIKNVEGARAAGWQAIHYRDGADPVDELMRLIESSRSHDIR